MSAPRVTVLHLDTHFPRPPGDIGCAETFAVPPDIRRVPGATARGIVGHNPGRIDLRPFFGALRGAHGDVVTTSCGFLAPHQDSLVAATGLPVVASALGALPGLVARFGADAVAVLTFDAEAARALCHAGGLGAGSVIGLHRECHLRRVIESDADHLDTARAAAEIVDLLRGRLCGSVRVLLLECTNLPPYLPDIRKAFSGEIVSILTCIEARAPGAVRPRWL